MGEGRGKEGKGEERRELRIRVLPDPGRRGYVERGGEERVCRERGRGDGGRGGEERVCRERRKGYVERGGEERVCRERRRGEGV